MIATATSGVRFLHRTSSIWGTPIKMMELSSCCGKISINFLSSSTSATSKITPTISTRNYVSRKDKVNILISLPLEAT